MILVENYNEHSNSRDMQEILKVDGAYGDVEECQGGDKAEAS